MKQISFINDVIQDICSGKKTGTLRLPEDQFEVGSQVILTNKAGKIFGKLQILSATPVCYRDLTVEDAKTHNWKSLDELRQRLKQIYGDRITEDTVLTHYHFKYVKNDLSNLKSHPHEEP